MRAANKAGYEERRKQLIDEKGRRKDAAERARRLAEQADMPAVAPIDAPKQERHVDAPLVDPAPTGGLLEVFSNRYLLRLVVRRELAKMYAASALGLLWSYIQPAMRFTIFYLIFAVIMGAHKGIPNFALHLFCGMVFVGFFMEMWSGGTRSVWNNSGLVMKMRVPREIFPVASFIVSLYHTGPQVLVLMALCIFLGWHLTLSAIIFGLVGIAIIMAFGLAMGLIFAALNVLYRDTQNVVGTISMFVHFLVPQMYPYTMVANVQTSHPLLYNVYMSDPLAVGVLDVQKLFWAATSPNPALVAAHFPHDLWLRSLIVLGACLVLLYLAQKFFARLESKFPERL